ncbi:hypothetical protein RB595_003741 [Gaeumannomyces hyphopodioides]
MDEDDLLLGCHLRDGRYGPVILAITRETGDLLQAHRLDLNAAGVATVLQNAARCVNQHQHQQKQQQQQQRQQQPANVVSIVGPYRAAGHVYVLTEHVPSDLDNIFGYLAPGTKPPLPLMRVLLRGAARGVEQARGLGFDVVLPELRHVAVDNIGVAKIGIPLHDVAAGDDGGLPAALRTLPERVAAVRKNGEGEGGGAGVDRREMLRGADVWLLGVLAAQCVSGTPGFLVVGDEADEAEAVVARLVEEERERDEGASAFERLVPERVVRMLEDEPDWVDFLRRCFVIDPEQRPTVAELHDHPLFAPSSPSPPLLLQVGMN